MKVLNFGSLNIDNVYCVENFVRKGETIHSENLSIFPGGKGLNQSIAMARAGLTVYHAGAIGEDGEFLTDLLSMESVNTENIRRDCNVRTGNAIIQNDREGDNAIILFGGANQNIDRKHVDGVLKGFDKGDVLVLQNEISSMAYIMDLAYRRGMKIILNPSPMNKEIFRLPLSYVDTFFVNEIEAMELLGRYEEDYEKLIKELSVNYSPSKILMTLGEKGSMYHDGKKIYRQKAVKVEALDTTAAGDTFTGYFLAGMIENEKIENILAMASIASSIAVTRKGAAPSIPYYDEVKAKYTMIFGEWLK